MKKKKFALFCISPSQNPEEAFEEAKQHPESCTSYLCLEAANEESFHEVLLKACPKGRFVHKFRFELQASESVTEGTRVVDGAPCNCEGCRLLRSLGEVEISVSGSVLGKKEGLH